MLFLIPLLFSCGAERTVIKGSKQKMAVANKGSKALTALEKHTKNMDIIEEFVRAEDLGGFKRLLKSDPKLYGETYEERSEHIQGNGLIHIIANYPNSKSKSFLQYLESLDAMKFEEGLALQNKEGFRAQDIALRRGAVDLYEYLHEKYPIHHPKNLKTNLSHAIKNRNTAVMKKIVEEARENKLFDVVDDSHIVLSIESAAEGEDRQGRARGADISAFRYLVREAGIRIDTQKFYFSSSKGISQNIVDMIKKTDFSKDKSINDDIKDAMLGMIGAR